MKKEEDRRREMSCTRKRAFQTASYAAMYLENVLRRIDEMDVYRCRFCREYHLGHRTRVR